VHYKNIFSLLLIVIAVANSNLMGIRRCAVWTSLGDSESATQLKTLLGFNNPSLPGDVPIYYSPGYQAHAKIIQDFLSGERNFYRRELGIDFALTAAVLDAKQWGLVQQRGPYGVPNVSLAPPYLALIPADWNDTHLGIPPKPEDANPLLVKEVRDSGQEWKATFFRGFDAVIGHEFGHAATRVYGIKPPTYWMDEFLATYFEIAYAHQERPDFLFPIRIFNLAGLDYPHPYSTLDEFEAQMRSFALSPPNYGWYQSMFWKRGEDVFARKGLLYLTEMKVAFPAGGTSENLSSVELLRKLDRICPGFTEWANSLHSASLQNSK
jgi:hypothetical protein